MCKSCATGIKPSARRSFPLPMGVIQAEREVTAPIRNPKPHKAAVANQVTVAAILAAAWM